jgi:hypothetical protein
MHRLVIVLAFPVAILLFLLMVTILRTWVSGTGLCDTWIATWLQEGYCR